MKARQRWDQWEAIGAAAVFVVFDEPDLLQQTLFDGIDVAELPFEVAVDRERVSYDAWGLTRARHRDIWLDPNVYRTYWRLMRAGDRLRPGGSDVLQLGGDFVVDSRGRIVYARPQERDDRPAVSELLAAAKRMRGPEDRDP